MAWAGVQGITSPMKSEPTAIRNLDPEESSHNEPQSHTDQILTSTHTNAIRVQQTSHKNRVIYSYLGLIALFYNDIQYMSQYICINDFVAS